MINRKLLKARLGIFDKTFLPDDQSVSPGYDDNVTRLHVMGGNLQQDRMIRGKQQSLDRALQFSYQAAEVKKLNEDHIVRALINPDKLKQDYDDKIISIHYVHGYTTGDIFEWVGTGTYWLIYLQELSELAYFRGEIRKCSYEISWEDEDEIKSTYAAIRGPVETQIDSRQKHNTVIDEPNYTLHILMPKNEDTLKKFKRYTKFYLKDLDGNVGETCWRVAATDSISTPGILELTAIEYFSNEFEDENGIVGALIEPIPDPTPSSPIEGETFIKPYQKIVYKGPGGSWTFDREKLPIHVIEETSTQITLSWQASYSGQFDIKNGNAVKTIIVESLF